MIIIQISIIVYFIAICMGPITNLKDIKEDRKRGYKTLVNTVKNPFTVAIILFEIQFFFILILYFFFNFKLDKQFIYHYTKSHYFNIISYNNNLQRNEMKEYDVIIIGAGIAGTGLAYNLNKECPEKKVLIIDAKEPGSNASYGYRNIMESLQKEYNFPYEHMYKGMKIGIEDKIFFTLNRKFYFINYKKICNKLLRESKAEFKKGFAKEFNSKILKTDKENYKFKYLVDCSGSSFFIKKKLRHKLPFRYWMAKTRVLKNELKDKDYYYYQFHDSGYFEDIYPLKNKTLQGDWQYTEKRDLNLLKPIENQLYKKLISKPKIIKEYIV